MNASRPTTALRRSGFAALFSALVGALQWRLLLWWVIALALPAGIAALPIWSALAAQFSESPHAAAIAGGTNLPLLIDGLVAMRDGFGGITAGMIVAVAIALLLSPWLTGMVVASIRAQRTLRMAELLHAGLTEYGRMLRMMLWSVIPFGVALAIGAGVSSALDKHAADAILSADAERLGTIGTVVLAVLALIAHATLEAGRGQLAADPTATSTVRAWWRGVRLVLHRPLAALIVYFGIAIVGYAIALMLLWLRLRIGSASAGGFVTGLLVTQLIVAALAWTRIARLHAFADLSRDAIARQSPHSVPRVDTGDAMANSAATSAAA